jgi:hypothetical protein
MLHSTIILLTAIARDHGVFGPGGLRISAVGPEGNVTQLQRACKAV